MADNLLPGYTIRRGSIADRGLLLKFMQRSYQDNFPHQDFSHLGQTVEQYLSQDTPLWWVEEDRQIGTDVSEQKISRHTPVACLWAGNAVDQVRGNRHTHIFLVYVVPEYRRRGIGTALMCYVEKWATQRGDRQIGLQVFANNQPALNLYNQSGYQTQSLWMVKTLSS